MYFGIPCGKASTARLRRLSKKHHGFFEKVDLAVGQSGSNLDGCESFYKSSWETSYWRDIAAETDPLYCQLLNCMFGGQRLKRTYLASNNRAIMALKVLCDGRHNHAPWSMTDGVFDTALEAEYAP